MTSALLVTNAICGSSVCTSDAETIVKPVAELTDTAGWMAAVEAYPGAGIETPSNKARVHRQLRVLVRTIVLFIASTFPKGVLLIFDVSMKWQVPD
jgi:hypothetical protein